MSFAPELPRTRRRCASVGVTLSLALAIAPSALAQDKLTLGGTWSASPLSERWTVSSWGDACGPKPASAGGGGGTVTVREQGSELAFLGGGRAWSTAECWDAMPGLARTSHSASGLRAWTTRCSTPANDPRRAAVVTRVSATDTTISMSETGDYQFIVNGTVCSASVSRSRSYTLVRRDGDEAPAASAAAAVSAPSAAPTTAPEAVRPARPCQGELGPPARLEVTPAKKLVRAGDTFTFRVAVTDAFGCPIAAKPAWSVRDKSRTSDVELDGNGRVNVVSSAREGDVELVASLGGKDASVTVEIVSPETYDALLARGDSSLESGGTSVAVLAGAVGGHTTATEDSSAVRKRTFVTVVVGFAALLALTGLALLRRGKRAPSAATLPPESTGSPGRARGGLPLGDDDGSDVGRDASRGAPTRGTVCPVCGELYGDEAIYCGADGATLVRVN